MKSLYEVNAQIASSAETGHTKLLLILVTAQTRIQSKMYKVEMKYEEKLMRNHLKCTFYFMNVQIISF